MKRVRIEPRLLIREDLADYLSCSESTVDRLVERGDLPPPQRWSDGMVRWDRKLIDQIIDRLSGLQEESDIGEAINAKAARRRALLQDQGQSQRHSP